MGSVALPITGVGAQFLRWNSSSHEWEAIAHCRSITGPGKTRATVDTTSLDTLGGYRTFIAGFRDAGTVTLACLFTRDGYELLNTDFESDTPGDYQIVLPDPDVTTLTFKGYVTEVPLTIPEDVVTVNVVIKISGVVTLESGSMTSPGA